MKTKCRKKRSACCQPTMKPRRLNIETLEAKQMLAGNPIISEFAAINDGPLTDGDGNTSDWIEIFNSGDAAIDLAGYHLTDDQTELDKWTFPSKTLQAGEYLVVFASGQLTDNYVDPGGNLHTNFKLNSDGEYLGLIKPDGTTIATEFAPEFPKQRADFSYGVGQQTITTTLVDEGAAGQLLIPDATDDTAIGSTWTGNSVNEPFDTLGWTAVNTGVGFDFESTTTQMVNVALGKAVSTSGATFNNGAQAASMIVDGNNQTISHPAGTEPDVGFFYTINLSQQYDIDTINVLGRADGCPCADRLSDYRVEVFDVDPAIGSPAAVFTIDNTNMQNVNARVDAIENVNVTGQWVRITSLVGSVNFSPQIAEVEVMVEQQVGGTPEGQNLAAGAVVTASGPTWGSFLPTFIADDNRSTFSHPLNQGTTFYYDIKLDASTEIGFINIVNRGDGCCTDRLSNYRVSVFADDNGSIGTLNWSADIRTDLTNSGSGGVDLLTRDLDPTGDFEGQWIRIERIDNGALNYWPQIAEVEVFAPTSYDADITSDIETEMKDVNASAYLRIPFNVTDPNAFDQLLLELKYDDGFVAYLNGTEIARDQAPAGTPVYNATATASHSGAQFQQFIIPLSELQIGTNILAIQGLNEAIGDSDFLLLPKLIGTSITQQVVGYFAVETPGTVNSDTVTNGFVDDVVVDVERGFFDVAFDVNLTSATPGATIIYTTDGSQPSLTNGTQVAAVDAFTTPVAIVNIPTTTTLRAAAFLENFEPSSISTNTYIFLNDVLQQSNTQAGLPTVWDGVAQGPRTADYEVDPEIVNDPAYSAEIIAGLRDIPTMSIVMDPDALWGSANGIYINSGQRGKAWERPTSVEIIEPDGTTFQADSGIRIHGFSWRFHSNTPKHSLRLEFRDEYGPSRLDYKLFPNSEVDRFDSIVLRAQGGRSWGGTQAPAQSQYQRDTFARDLSDEMGRIDGHATLVHLYLNGLYWGLYNPVERPDAQFAEENFGGSDEDYDALNRRTTTNEAIDGDLVRYNEMIALAQAALTAGVTTNANVAALESYLDVENFIDFMILNQYVTNRDGITWFGGNNQRAIGSRIGDAKFRFFTWDMEFSMWNATDNIHVALGSNSPAQGADNPSTGSWEIYKALQQNEEFRLRYADRVQIHLFNDGALTPQNAAQTWETRAESIERAIIAESARWGDATGTQYTRDDHWQVERDRLNNTYFPVRTGALLEDLTEADMYPTTGAPEFNQFGGEVASGFDLVMTTPTNSQNFTDTTLLSLSNVATALVPTDDSLGDTWQDLVFDDTAWLSGTNGVGYERGTGFEPLIGLDLLSAGVDSSKWIDTDGDGTNENNTVYARFSFNAGGINPNDFDRMLLRMRYDDAFVVYLNGVEVGSSALVPNPLDWNSASTATGGEGATQEIDITAFLNNLNPTNNVLAVHALNQATISSDMLIMPELVVGVLDPLTSSTIYYTTDGTDPRELGGAVNLTSAIEYTGPVELLNNADINARALTNGTWSALTSTTFVVGTPTISVTELMYNPHDPTATELLIDSFFVDDDFEFIELINTGSEPVDLLGLQFTDGVEVDFSISPITSIASGERVVVVASTSAFQARYGSSATVVGQFVDSGLKNSGEIIQLSDGVDREIFTFAYSDSGDWPGRADGNGSSLELIDPLSIPTSQPALNDFLGNGLNWRSSIDYLGSPGIVATQPQASVIVNEVLAHSDLPDVDFIELYNPTAQSIVLDGWWLSDANNQLAKFQIPLNTSIAAGTYLVFDESDFNPTPLTPGPNDFALSGSHGDDVWLTKGALGNPTPLEFVDHVEFGASFNTVSFGRVPNGDVTGELYPNESVTNNGANSDPLLSTLFISEVMYHPTNNNSDLEFLEIYNSDTVAVDLTDWRLDKGVDFDFAPGASIAGESALVILPFDPTAPVNAAKVTAFETEYGVTIDSSFLGPYTGKLSNEGERVQLQEPDDPPVEEPAFTPHPLVDEVNYETLAPWPIASGNGESINRTNVNTYGNDPTNWQADLPTPGSVNLVAITPGDFDSDGDIDNNDLAFLLQSYGKIVAVGTDADISGPSGIADGRVGLHDLLLLKKNYTGPLSSAPAPQAAESLVVAIGVESENTQQASSEVVQQNNHAIDRAIVVDFDFPSNQSDQQSPTLRVARANRVNSQAAIDRALSDHTLSQVERSSRRATILRAHRSTQQRNVSPRAGSLGDSLLSEES